jgi:hypothetical protein
MDISSKHEGHNVVDLGRGRGWYEETPLYSHGDLDLHCQNGNNSGSLSLTVCVVWASAPQKSANTLKATESTLIIADLP